WVILLAIRATLLPDLACSSICEALTLTIANSAATKKPLASTNSIVQNRSRAMVAAICYEILYCKVLRSLRYCFVRMIFHINFQLLHSFAPRLCSLGRNEQFLSLYEEEVLIGHCYSGQTCHFSPQR